MEGEKGARIAALEQVRKKAHVSCAVEPGAGVFHGYESSQQYNTSVLHWASCPSWSGEAMGNSDRLVGMLSRVQAGLVLLDGAAWLGKVPHSARVLIRRLCGAAMSAWCQVRHNAIEQAALEARASCLRCRRARAVYFREWQTEARHLKMAHQAQQRRMEAEIKFSYAQWCSFTVDSKRTHASDAQADEMFAETLKRWARQQVVLWQAAAHDGMRCSRTSGVALCHWEAHTSRSTLQAWRAQHREEKEDGVAWKYYKHAAMTVACTQWMEYTVRSRMGYVHAIDGAAWHAARSVGICLVKWMAGARIWRQHERRLLRAVHHLARGDLLWVYAAWRVPQCEDIKAHESVRALLLALLAAAMSAAVGVWRAWAGAARKRGYRSRVVIEQWLATEIDQSGLMRGEQVSWPPPYMLCECWSV